MGIVGKRGKPLRAKREDRAEPSPAGKGQEEVLDHVNKAERALGRLSRRIRCIGPIVRPSLKRCLATHRHLETRVQARRGPCVDRRPGLEILADSSTRRAWLKMKD